MHKPKEDSYSL